MRSFWRLAAGILHYRLLLLVSVLAAVIDALCAGGSLATLLWLIDQLFNRENALPVRELVRQRLSHPALEDRGVHLAHLADYVPASDFGGFAFVLGLVFCLAAIGTVARYIQASTALTAVFRTILRVRQRAYHAMLHAPLARVQQEGTGDAIVKLVRDSNGIARGLNALTTKSIRDLLMGMVFLALALSYDWFLTGIFLLALPPIAVLIRVFGRRMRKASKGASQSYGRLTTTVQESMQALAVVKAHRAEGTERRHFNAINRKVLKQELRARTVRALSGPLIELIALLGVVGVSLVAGYAIYVKGVGDPGNIVKVMAMLAAAGASLKPLANLNNSLQESAASAQRLDEVFRLPTEFNRNEHHGPTAPPPLPRHRETLRFDNVHYRYPKADGDAVRGVSLEVPFSETLAVVGTNGSGKSTLLAMLPRLLEPTVGRIYIDGVDTSTGSLRSLRDQIAMVTQQTHLFEGTIAANIAYGMGHAPRPAILAAAEAARVDEFVRDLPRGYDTKLGEGGLGLSGGQKQRLAIARAILRDPAILILDEATSQIDTDSERQINAALDALRTGRTTFLIAHRMSTVRTADRILVMRDGQVEALGRHDDLLHSSETYALLTRSGFA